jgi:CBS domain containing-hemolysin-like protein
VILLVLQIALLIVLLFLSSVFSGSETALFSLKPYQVRKLRSAPSRSSIRVSSLLEDPYHLLVTILIGNTLVNVAASSIGTDITAKFLENGVVGVSVAVMGALILLFGEIVPKTVAVSNPLMVSLRFASLTGLAVRLFTPLKGMLASVIRLVVKLNLMRLPGRTRVIDEHVAEAIAAGHSEGVLDRFEGGVLSGIFRITHLSAQNIMTPRTEVFMLGSDVSIGEAVPLVKSSGYSRIPVFEDDRRDSIKGVVYAKDLLYKQHSTDLRLADIARRPVFVPESKTLANLLQEFVSGAAHFAVVIDEYGSFAGVVTLDDILMEIVGRDVGSQTEKFRYVRKSRSKWEIPGRMEIEYFNALVGTALSETNVETVAGLIIERIGRIPEVGEEVIIRNLRFRVTEATERSVRRIEVEKLRK